MLLTIDFERVRRGLSLHSDFRGVRGNNLRA